MNFRFTATVHASRRPARALVASAVVLAAAVLMAACTTSSPGEPAATIEPVTQGPALTLEDVTQRGPFGVGVATFELVDRARPTEPNRDYAGADERRLVVEVWYPADPSAATPEARDAPVEANAAPYPLIVFAHGLGSFRRQSVSYTQHLASHGYVVASPDFPLSNLRSPGGARLAAVVNQPGDVSFLIDRLLEFSRREGHLLAGAIDEEAIGMTGHSLGGLTTLLTAYGPDRDPRLKAALPIAGPGCFLTEDVVDDMSVPIMVLIASNDLLVGRESSRRAYDLANPPRYFVEVVGANHTRFADVDLTDEEVLALFARAPDSGVGGDAAQVAQAIGGSLEACVEEAPSPDEVELISAHRQQELLRAFATPFFDAYLRENDAAKTFLQDELPGLVPEANFEFEAE